MKNYIIIFVVLVIAGAGFIFLMKTPVQAPVVTPSISPTPEQNIIILSPKPGESVSNPIIVKGKARVFEATFSYRLKDASGRVILENNSMTTGASVPEYGDINIKIPVPVLAPEIVSDGTPPNAVILEVFEYSAKDGSIVNLVTVPLQLASTEKTTIKTYFSSSKLDPAITCTKVFPIERSIYKSPEVGFMALSELMRGLLPSDKTKGYTTSIPERVAVNSLIIRDGVAYADFNYQLETYGGGSCRVSAIRAQITETLRQFPAVKNVVISVDGRTEDILQP